jgi:hypothetical protein
MATDDKKETLRS